MIEISKRLQNFLVAASVFVMSFNLANATAGGQENLGSAPRSGALPNTPQPTQPGDESSQSGEAGIPGTGTGRISGTVIDPSGDVLQCAQVTLNGSRRFIPVASYSNSISSFAPRTERYKI